MNDIANIMDLNKGTLYYYFPAKSDILFAVYDQSMRHLDENVGSIPGGLEPQKLLVEYIRAMVRTITDTPDLIAVYFQEHPWLEETLAPDQAEMIRSKEKAFNDSIADVISSGVRNKVFRSVNNEVLATQLLAMVSSIYQWPLDDWKRSSDLLADTMIDYLLKGILIKE